MVNQSLEKNSVRSTLTVLPIILIWNSFQFWSEAPQMIRLVTLVAQDLLFWAVLPPTHAASTVFALAARVIPAPITVRLLHAFHALPIAHAPLTRLGPSLDAENLVNKFDLDFLGRISRLAARNGMETALKYRTHNHTPFTLTRAQAFHILPSIHLLSW